MGEILDNVKNAAAGNPYWGSGNNNSQTSNTSKPQTPIMGDPQILKHSLDYSGSIMQSPMRLNENANSD